MVERRTRASFECHPDLLVGDFEDKEYDESELELIDFEFVELRLVRHTL